MKVLFNEDKPLGFLRIEEVIEFLLYQRTIHLQFQSPEKIQDDLEDFVEIVIEGLQIKKDKVKDKKEKLRMGRLIKRMESFIMFSRYKKTNLKLTAHIFEF